MKVVVGGRGCSSGLKQNQQMLFTEFMKGADPGQMRWRRSVDISGEVWLGAKEKGQTPQGKNQKGRGPGAQMTFLITNTPNTD